MEKQTEIRIKQGRKITTLEELREFQAEIVGNKWLFGSASNYEVVHHDSVLYSEGDLYTKERLYVPVEGMAAVNVIAAAMGRGKTTVINNLITSFPDHRMIINDPKSEFCLSFFDAKKDVLMSYMDEHGVVLHVFKVIQQDPQMADLIFTNMLLQVRGGEENKDGMEWVTYGVNWLCKLAARINEGNIPLENIPVEIVRLFKEFKAETAGMQTGMQSDALGTAAPVFNLLFQMYYIGTRDKRRFVTIEDIMEARRVFMCNDPRFAKQIDILNNALLACVINAFLSRPNVPRECTDKYTFFVLDEYLTFKLDKASETNLLTLCRSKGLSVWLGMQHLPTSKEKLTSITASRYLTVFFRLDDDNTPKEADNLMEPLEYQRREYTVSLSDSNSLASMSGGVNINETWVDVKTKQVPREVLTSLSPHVAYIEINDLYMGRHRTFARPVYVKTLTNPVRVNEETGEEGFLYSDVARHAPRIDEVM